MVYENENNKPANMYMHTLIFATCCLLVAIVVVALFASKKYVERVAPYKLFMVTVLFGLFAMSLLSLLAVWRYESNLKKMRDAANDPRRLLSVSACPDYWTLEEDGSGKRTCRRQYTADESVGYISMPGNKNTVDLKEYDLQPALNVCNTYEKDLQTSWSALKDECEAYNY
jgi:hypothetical protein